MNIKTTTKTILVSGFFLFVAQLPVAHADTDTLFDFDPSTVSVCSTPDTACQIQNAQLRVLVESLLQQVVLEITTAEKLATTTPWYQEADYQAALRESPLDNNEKKVFRVRDGEVRGLDENSHPIYRELWRIFSTIAGPEHLEYFDEFRIYYKRNDPQIAYVKQYTYLDRDGELVINRELAVNLYNARLGGSKNNNDIVRVLAHEAVHIFTLESDQIDYFVDKEDCDSFYHEVFKGCARPGSYFDHYDEHFWSDEYYQWSQDYLEAYAKTPHSSRDIITDYYEEHYYDFATTYATSQPGEDIAESMMYFLTAPRREGELEVYEQKIDIFFSFPDAVEIRERTRPLMQEVSIWD